MISGTINEILKAVELVLAKLLNEVLVMMQFYTMFLIHVPMYKWC